MKHSKQTGVALVITLIMLSVITVMAVSAIGVAPPLVEIAHEGLSFAG